MPLIIVVLLWIAGEAWLLARLSERIGGAWVVALLALQLWERLRQSASSPIS